MRHWDELLREQRNGLTVVVDKSWEDIPLDHLFDTSIDPDTGKPYYDVDEMARQVDAGDLEWFMLRVRVMLDGHELGSHYLGGLLYDWNKVKDVMTDGTAEDCIYSAMEEAKTEVRRLRDKLMALEV